MDDGQSTLIARFPKNKAEHYRIELGSFKGKHFVGLRIWYTDKATGGELPTQKGVNLPLSLVEVIAEALLKGLALGKGEG